MHQWASGLGPLVQIGIRPSPICPARQDNIPPLVSTGVYSQMAAREVAKAQCRKENQPLAPPMDASGRGEETRNIQSVLHSATAADIPTGDRAPIVISDDQPLVDALKFIADAWVRACPVRDTSTNTIIGTLDLRDIGQFMVRFKMSVCHNNLLA